MNDSTNNISIALTRVRSQINSLAIKHGRDPNTVTLLAVSKTKPVQQIRAAHAAGQWVFGENYVDEAVQKITDTHELDARWHFIGSIQSRKCAEIAKHFSWVHSVERIKVARKLSQQLPANKEPLQICLQVNIDGEATKSGVLANDVSELAAQCSELPGLTLRGLMAIPAPQTEMQLQRDAFARLRQLHESLQIDHPTMDTLSMGMSGDLEAAIAEGATIVRVGTAIFGARDYPAKSS